MGSKLRFGSFFFSYTELRVRSEDSKFRLEFVVTTLEALHPFRLP